MIDPVLMREHPDEVRRIIKRKDPSFEIDRLIALEEAVRLANHALEEARAEKNALAREGKGGLTETLRERSIAITEKIKGLEAGLVEKESEFTLLYLSCPNLIQEDVQDGGKESNKTVKEWGEKPTFSFEPKTHADLGKALGWLDFEAAAAMTASNFALYRKEAVVLHYSLCMFMFNTARSFGYEPVLPPFLINEKALEGSSNFPRFKEEVYAIEKDGLFLTPTAEVNLANLYRDQILSAETLPVRLTGLTSCFRREAGGYGAAERGLIRIHQFDKVELFSLCRQEESPREQDRMIACAESILQKLQLHYRISLLAAQDCSFASSKTYDIEVWMPGQKEYKEVSSISNCTDFQSRRCGIRYREAAGEKTKLVHTHNGSSLALPRLVVALYETGQQADGSIKFPEILRSISIGV